MSELTLDEVLEPPRHLVLVYAREYAFVPMTRSILARLGYALLDPEAWRESQYWADREPELLVVDEPRLAEAQANSSRSTPILLLTGRRGVTSASPQLLGAVHKPAGLHELYRLLEQALEDPPRAAPRVGVDLPAQVKRDGREWQGELLSLSESGCLLRSSEPLPPRQCRRTPLRAARRRAHRDPRRLDLPAASGHGPRLRGHAGCRPSGDRPLRRARAPARLKATSGRRPRT